MRALLIILAFAISSTAVAFPGFDNFGCEGSGCHDNPSPAGDVGPIDDIDVLIDSLGNQITLSLRVDDAFADKSTIALSGTDALGLDLTVGTPDTWNLDNTNFIYADPLIDRAEYSDQGVNNNVLDYILTFDVGPDAVLGTYLIDVKFAGGSTGGPDKWADITSFNVNVTPIPIPAAVWLFGSGLLGLVGVARRRRRNA